MRALVVIPLLAGCGQHIRAVPTTDRDAPDCHAHGNAIEIANDSEAAPLVVLHEYGAFIGQELPTIALWADGTLLYSPAQFEWRQAHVDDATQIAHDVVAMLEHSTRRGDVEVDITDQRTIEIIARASGTWRFTRVYAAERGASGDGFAAAYRTLVALIPAQGSAYTPDELAVDVEPERGPARELDWPLGVPLPPPAGGVFVIPASHSAALATVKPHDAYDSVALHEGDHRWRIASIRRRYRGEAVIERVRDCALKR